jgi:hypothetical protein
METNPKFVANRLSAAQNPIVLYQDPKSQLQIASRPQTATAVENNNSNILTTYNIEGGGGLLLSYFANNKFNLCPAIIPLTAERKLESSSIVHMQDLICEGPIYGLVDETGADLILFDNAQNNEENLKGIFFNDVPVKSSFNDTLNYNRVSIAGKIGSEFQESMAPASENNLFSRFAIGIATSYDKNLYNLNVNKVTKYFDRGTDLLTDNTALNHLTYISSKIGQSQTNYGDKIGTSNLNTSIFNQRVYEECFGVTYEIKDENCDFVLIGFKINALYKTDKKTVPQGCFFGIQIGYKQNPDFNYFIVHKVYGIATSTYQFDMVLNIKDFNKSAQPFIKIYNFTTAPDVTDSRTIVSIGVSSITEIIDTKFKYPNSAYYYVSMDARGFGNIPTRSYNLKLLQIKVPENYDAEAKTYNGFWSGEFDPILRWTDNPAWILYDLVVNNRYGIGKFNLSESLVDKWSIYQIAKYCDELVPTFNNTKYSMVTVAGIGTYNKNNYIELSGSNLTSDQFPLGSLLCLTNLKFASESLTGESETIIKSFKKRILSVAINPTGNSAILLLCNDFGLHKSCSQFGEVKTFIQSITDIKTSDQAFAVFLNEILNTTSTKLLNFKNYIYNQEVFSDDEIDSYQTSSGKAAVRFSGFLDIVEPRFCANLFITSETDIVNLVNNFASIFKGLVYWSNDYLKFDNDRPKQAVYFFNNSNVKDGVFNYSGSSKDTRYTVAKVVYSDATDGYKDKTIYVEDKLNIRRYGYVEKEVLGFGVTSKSQAKRMGEWFLITNQIEQDLISFQAGPEAMLLNPGDIINVSDSLKLTSRFGGRVVSVNDNSEIILDSLYDFIKVGDSISFIIPRKSSSVSELNELSKTQATISDSQINNLSTTYVYTFVVSSIGKDGNFRTKITVTTDTAEKQNNFYTISQSSLWIYEKSGTNTSSAFNQKYRILGIKENNPVEYEISAVEYIKDKFTYVDNRDNLSANTIYSSDSANQNITIPRDIISFKSVPSSVIMGDNGIVSEDPQPYLYTEKYDYIFHGIDYTDSQVNNLFSVNVISVTKILDFINSDYASIKDAVKGLLIEYVLNSKKVTFIWHNGDQTVYKIAVPKIEEQNTLEFIRVYPLGVNDSFI